MLLLLTAFALAQEPGAPQLQELGYVTDAPTKIAPKPAAAAEATAATAGDPGAPQLPPPSEAPPFNPATLPPELAPWAAWVAERLPDRACAIVGGEPRCTWAGLVELQLDDAGGKVGMHLRLDRDAAVQLPGGAGAWPQGVRDGGSAVVVTSSDGLPTAWLDRGEHHLSWTVSWAGRPNGLQLPPGVGVVSLTLDGATEPFPLIDSAGLLRLGASDREGPGENRLEVDVTRRVQDGVPLLVSTHIELRASGTPREVALGKILVPGTEPFAVTADLPARLLPDGTLTVQLRPGTFRVDVEAISGAPVTALAAPTLPAPWPDQEVWAVQTDDRVRMVDLSGPPGIDPARTTLPEGWRGLPAFVLTPASPLQITELRRGEPEPAPNALTLERELWLDFDGGGLTVRDRFSGSMSQGWRLDVLAPASLGHAADHGEGLVVTTRDGQIGVELRDQQVDVLAEARVEGRPGRLPAVGWDQDVQSLSANLHLPPGWTLLWASGVDALSGPAADWTLFDLFYVLVLSLALSRLLGRGWGALALVALALTRHVDGSPGWLWVILTVLLALERVAPEGGWPAVLLRGTRRLMLLVLFGVLAPLVYTEVQHGLYPQLRQSYSSYAFETADIMPMTRAVKAVGSAGSSGYDEDRKVAQKKLTKVDPKAVVQTGPGVPDWAWDTWRLSWSGPVAAEHELRLWLLGPTANLLLAVLRSALLLLLALRVAGLKQLPDLRRAAPLAPLALLALLLPGRSVAAPDLDELEERLAVRPTCGEACATASTMEMQVEGDLLTVDAEVHAADITSWPLPGPAEAWVPAVVEVDGARSSALARLEDGALHLRLDPGVHRVRLVGPVPPTDALALDLPSPPQRVVLRSTSWSIDGVKADGTVAGTVQLVRRTPAVAGAMSESLPAWLEVERTLELGIPWEVRTVVRRVGPATQPVAVRVPLLVGESLTDDAWEVIDGAVQLTLKRDEAEASWTGSLVEAPELTLTAPTGVPWTETWTVRCAPIFACAAEGAAPLRHVADGEWSPQWRVWPGETLQLRVARPEGVSGQTITVDKAELDWTPGVRLGEGSLSLRVRSSQGGRLPVTLPAGAELRGVSIGGSDRPLQQGDGGVVDVPLQPGETQITVRWQEPHAVSLVDRVPEVTIGAAAVNVSVTVHPSPDRWILALRGPAWGPVPLFWGYLLLVLLAAPLLARLPYTPLSTRQWLLLGLGMTQVPIAVPMVVALVFLALGWRRAQPLENIGLFNLLQLALVVAVLVDLALLYASIHAGLLIQPDMEVRGAGSDDSQLRWLLDRTDGVLPTPVVVSLPLWTFRVLMLLWALWLAASLVRWGPWAWACWSEGGVWRSAPPKEKPAG
jgi:hypothetical protein